MMRPLVCCETTPRPAGCGCTRVDVLCGCGWGRLGLPQCDVPEFCPLCGFDFWSYGGPPELCASYDDTEPRARQLL